MRTLLFLCLALSTLFAQKTAPLVQGELPNGWKLTPSGKQIRSEDMPLGLTFAPDGKAMVAMHSGFNAHGLVVVDSYTDEATQRLPMKSAWYGLAWSADGKTLYASGGNAVSRQNPTVAPIAIYRYENGRINPQPAGEMRGKYAANETYWAGLAMHPTKPLLFAANRGTTHLAGNIAVFDTTTQQQIAEIPVEVNPYDLILTPDAKLLYVSNWGSDSISVIDVEKRQVIQRIAVGDNPNDMVLTKDGRIFVACGNSNSVWVVDTKLGRAVQQISTAMHSQAPVGSTPNALTLDPEEKLLFVANADNNNVAVVHIGEADEYTVMGFIPTGWYPCGLAISADGKKLYVGNGKGMGGGHNLRGPHSPLADDGGTEGKGSVKQLMKGSIEVIELSSLKDKIKEYTRQAMANSPYSDALLAKAQAPKTNAPSIVPQTVGAPSPIEHVIYVIRENRTYDQVLGDLPQGRGEPSITIFPRKVTPNAHKLAEEFVLFDYFFCDGEVSVDGHSWSNAAYATDFNEKLWPVTYGGHSQAGRSPAYVPAGGHFWDLAAKKGLTYRSYGEYATRSSDGTTMEAAPGIGALLGRVSPKFKLAGMRDTDNVKIFLQEFQEYVKNFDAKDPEKRLPNYIVMSLGEDHTTGTRPGTPTPSAAVANNDWALGQLVDAVSHSPYWAKTAIFIVEDDAQDGADHIDARRSVLLVASPYARRKVVDPTLYTTSSVLRTMELLLGLPPMTQYDAAAMPMYAAFTTTPNLAPFTAEAPRVDVNEMNTALAWGAKESMEMNLDEYDQAPMFALNEIVWKSVKGANSEMPLPVRRFHWRDEAPARER